MPRRQSDVERALCAKGFVARHGDHNYFLALMKIEWVTGHEG